MDKQAQTQIGGVEATVRKKKEKVENRAASSSILDLGAGEGSSKRSSRRFVFVFVLRAIGKPNQTRPMALGTLILAAFRAVWIPHTDLGIEMDASNESCSTPRN